MNKTYATITAGTVNVRKGAGVSYGAIAVLRRGARVEILEQMVNRAVEGILRPERITTQSIFPSGSFKQQKSRTCTGYIVLLDFIKMR